MQENDPNSFLSPSGETMTDAPPDNRSGTSQDVGSRAHVGTHETYLLRNAAGAHQSPSEKPAYTPRLKGTQPDRLVDDRIQRQAGGRRLNNKPVIIAAVMLGLLGYTILSSWFNRPAPMPGGETLSERQKPGPAQPTEILEKAPQAGVIGQNPSIPHEDPLIPANRTQNPNLQPSVMAAAYPPPPDPAEQARLQAWQQQQQEAAQREAARLAQLKAIREANSTVYTTFNPSPQAVPQASSGLETEVAALSDSLRRESGENGVQPISNEASATLKARLRAGASSAYLTSTRVPALSPYEIKAGAVIPSVMISGVNSDLPGQLIAQVAENVYDTATGRHLLIPQGARLLGAYDHGIVSGQSRVLIAWNRIIYPDASSLDLGAMSGQDQSGYAGFKDKINNHAWPTFRNALLLSVMTAGVQLSQPRTQKGDYSYSSQQMMAGALGMQMNQLGMSAYQNRATVPPTLTIRPGYRFNVMVSKDVLLPPWETANRQGSAIQSVARW